MLDKLIKTTCGLLALWMPFHAEAIYVGNQTFSMDPESRMVAKFVVNNNKEPRIYRVAIRAINSPGEDEINTKPADGELLFAPRQLTLQPGSGDFFKFFYQGPEDGKERYYRAAFEEIPPQNRTLNRTEDSAVSLIPVVVMDTILVVRPRDVNFKWFYNRAQGELSNSGNTWFKLLLKPSCSSTEDESDSWYIRPGDRLRRNTLKSAAELFIIYNDRFINIYDECS
ncbi:hypothetical protein AAEY27_13965 [Kosakonia sp. BYX6]|uniref:Fimbria/pilus periplasmic chaperone n=1 Tax=Kosakonia calanthes TaxID=3139408 RepID=A0ABZ3B6F7_9ENTR